MAMRTYLTAALIGMTMAAPAVGRGSDPTMAVCQSKADVVAGDMSEFGRTATTDLSSDQDALLAANLKHFEAIDITGADLMIMRRKGSAMSRVEVFRDGCRVRSILIENTYLNVLLRLRLEEGI